MKPRINKLRKELEKNKTDALLVSDFHDILYLTGFKTVVPDEREAWALVTKRKTYIFVDGRNSEALYAHVEKLSHIEALFISPETPLTSLLREILKKARISQIGFESHDLRFAEHKFLRKNLKGVTFKPQKNIIGELRAIKDEKELLKVKKAAVVADQCLLEISETIKIGQTEKEIAYRIEKWFKEKGYDLSFEPIVAVGKNASIPHYFTKQGNARLTQGVLLLIDYGVKVNDYCSDTTRMFSIGRPPAELQNIYQKLLEAQEKTIKKIKPSVTLKSLDKFVREKLKQVDLPNFGHGTGHGIGLEIHEAPKVSTKSKDKAHIGQVFTIEPGVYVPGKFGMRIEDMVQVTPRGVQILTSFDKRLRVL